MLVWRILGVAAPALSRLEPAAQDDDINVRIIANGVHSFALYGVSYAFVHDRFWHITEPGMQLSLGLKPNSMVSLRSTDMKFRTFIIVDKNEDNNTNAATPHKICVLNPMLEGGVSIEAAYYGDIRFA